MVNKSIYVSLTNNKNELVTDVYLESVSFDNYQETYPVQSKYTLYTGIDNQDYEKEYNSNKAPLYSVLLNIYNDSYKIYFEQKDIDSEKIITKSTVFNDGVKFSATIGPEDIDNNYKIKFFTLNDTYEAKYFGKWAQKVDEIISADNHVNTINIRAIAGDFLFINKTSSILEGHDIVLATNVAKFDFMGIGNHEFDQGLNTLNDLSSMSCAPFLCSNLDKEDLKIINALDHYSITKKGILFGCVSFCTPETSFLTLAAKDLKFKNMDYVLTKNKDFLEKSDIKILLFHDNIENILKYFEINPSKLYLIDVIITGHQHIIVNSYIKRDDYQIPVIQAGVNAQVVGFIEINYNKHQKKLTNISNQSIEIPNNFPQKPEIKEISDWVEKITKPYFEKSIGIIKEYPLNGIELDIRSIETNLGVCMADAL
jgi:2',3'-cyclic-nucleotide 2'-phosphodiesterase (5'-nucleotidase family)